MMQSVAVNTVRASRLDGPSLSASLLDDQPTVAIAVTGRYIVNAGGPGQGEWTTFLCRLSADRTTPAPSVAESPFSLARRLAGRSLEDHLLARRPKGLIFPCERFQTFRAFRDGLPSQLRALLPLQARDQDHFCDKCCADTHEPVQSTFPGARNWTFATGAESFDEASADGRRPAPPAALAPEDTLPLRAPRALIKLRDEVARAREQGFTDLWVAVEATDPTSLKSWDMYEMQTLVGTCLAETALWCAPESHVVNYRVADVAVVVCAQRGALDAWHEER